jgi:hypothetical protein
LLLKPPKYLAINVFGLHMTPEACVENDVAGFIADVDCLSWLVFFVKY